jgi:DNA-binding beta-propeller fold protein YncE
VGEASRSDAISVIDTRARNVTDNILSIWRPTALAFNPENGYVYVVGYVSVFGNQFVSVIDSLTNAFIRNIEIPGSNALESVVYNPSNGKMYVTNVLEDKVFVIDENDT